MIPKPLFPPSHWRHLLRALLRECSYLPDPIARGYMHDHVMHRFRRYSDKTSQWKLQRDILQQSYLQRVATYRLSFLRRANEGYYKPLEKVLLQSYARTGKRRRDLLNTFIAPEVPPNTAAVAELVSRPAEFEDGWQPPAIVVDLLKAQLRNAAVGQQTVRPTVKTVAPQIPAQNSWGKPLPLVRRRNIRRRWYNAVLESLLPPLPEAEYNLLEGLITGIISWAPVKRRTAVGTSSSSSKTSLDAKFLVEGPQKGTTFDMYVNGRPHVLTRRFMRRLWQRIYVLVPRATRDPKTNKPLFTFVSPRQLPNEKVKPSLSLGGKSIPGLLDGIDETGKSTR